jgi:hypothetical protein
MICESAEMIFSPARTDSAVWVAAAVLISYALRFQSNIDRC